MAENENALSEEEQKELMDKLRVENPVLHDLNLAGAFIRQSQELQATAFTIILETLNLLNDEVRKND